MREDLRILYWPQLSMRSYASGKWLINSDAQFNKALSNFGWFPESWIIDWIMPLEESIEDWQWKQMLLESRYRNNRKLVGTIVQSKIHQIKHMGNVLENRFFFPFDEIVRILKENEFDLMLLEIPEHAQAMRLAMRTAGAEFPIISMVEHVDLYAETARPTSFFLRQIEGALASDLVVFPLKMMKVTWAANAKVMVRDMDKHEYKFKIWPGLHDFGHKISKVTNKPPVVGFISRLSDNPRTHFMEFIDAVNMIDERVKFSVWFANPNEAKSWEWIRQSCFRYAMHPWGDNTLTRADYKKFLEAADIVPILYPLDSIYSIGAMEALDSGNLLLTDRSVRDLDRMLGIGCDPRDPSDIARVLSDILQSPYTISAAAQIYREKALTYHGAYQNRNFPFEDIEALLG